MKITLEKTNRIQTTKIGSGKAQGADDGALLFLAYGFFKRVTLKFVKSNQLCLTIRVQMF